jgi:hypothetical protein
MRPIKFRGKRKDNGEWVYGFYCEFQKDHYIACFDGYATSKKLFFAEYFIEVVPETVGQFIDFYNGKEGYEDDIVEIDTSVGKQYIRLKMGLEIDSKCNSVIIGNACENPELLTQKRS